MRRGQPHVAKRAASFFGGDSKRNKSSLGSPGDNIEKIIERMGKSLQEPAGPLYGKDVVDGHDSDGLNSFIPQVPLHELDGRRHKRILM